MLLAKRDEFARKAEWFRFLAARDRGTLHPNGTPSDGSDRLGLDSSIEGSPPAPKRSLKPFLTTLWLTGAAMYLISTVLFTNAINGLGDKNEQEPNLEVNRQLASPRDFASNEETAQVQSTASPTSPAPYGTHAISPGQPPYESPDLIVPAAAMGEGNNTSSVPQERTQQASAPPASPEPEVLEVHQAATIQNGPSSAAAVIGTARPGAQVQIKARENAWIQFVDPTSGNTGWMESYLLTTPGSPQGGSNVAEHAENSPGLPLQTPKPVKKRVKKKSSEPPEIAEQRPSVPPARDRAYAELHEDDGFVVDRSFRRNGFLAKPRMLRQGLMSPDFIPPR